MESTQEITLKILKKLSFKKFIKTLPEALRSWDLILPQIIEEEENSEKIEKLLRALASCKNNWEL